MRSNYTIQCLSFCILFYFFGCTSIQSIRDPNFGKEIKKVFVYLKGSSSADYYLNEMGMTLKDKFISYGVQTVLYNANALNLDGNEDIKKRINLSGADMFMTIYQTEMQTYNGVTTGGTFEIKLYSVENNKPIWSAVLSTQNSIGALGNSNEGTENIVDRLEKDMLIKKRDVVYLNNGSIIKGRIIEYIPGKTIKIQTSDGNIYSYQYSDIQKVSKD